MTEWIKLAAVSLLISTAITATIGIAGFAQDDPLLANLGKYTTGKGCLYIKRLADVDQSALKTLVAAALKKIKSEDKAKG